jgi:endonuclease/exonuclease/phosphatase family metal-dependent hydrolase
MVLLTYTICAFVLIAPALLYLLLGRIFRTSIREKKRQERIPTERLISIPQFRFNQINGSWEKYCCKASPLHDNTILKIATFNTLFDLYAPRFSEQRYEYQLTKLLPSLDADIIALNEVTKHYLANLLTQDWVREKYFISRFSDKYKYRRHVDTKHFFCIILSRRPFHALYHYWFHSSVRTKRPAVIGLYKRADGDYFSVCSAHLAARRERQRDRAQQISELIQILSHPRVLLPDSEKLLKYDSLLLGDLNLHVDSEDRQFHSRRNIVVKDLWKELRPHEEGYTLDAYRNSLLKNGKTSNNIRLRLDRIMAIQVDGIATNFHYKNIEMFGDEPVDRDSYIFPSDHFGLMVRIGFWVPTQLRTCVLL